MTAATVTAGKSGPLAVCAVSPELLSGSREKPVPNEALAGLRVGLQSLPVLVAARLMVVTEPTSSMLEPAEVTMATVSEVFWFTITTPDSGPKVTPSNTYLPLASTDAVTGPTVMALPCAGIALCKLDDLAMADGTDRPGDDIVALFWPSEASTGALDASSWVSDAADGLSAVRDGWTTLHAAPVTVGDASRLGVAGYQLSSVLDNFGLLS